MRELAGLNRYSASPVIYPAGIFLTLAALCTPQVAIGEEAAKAQGSGDRSNLESVIVRAPRKLDLPLLTEPVAETPQTITLITKQMIDLAALTDLRDVLRFDPSVSAHADEDSGQGTNVQIRGFSARNDLYRDGQLDIGRYYRDPFDTETVAVLTGPSSVLFGRGSTGGAINSVSKKPSLSPFRSGDVSLGSDGLARIVGDVNAPLSPSSAIRINAMVHTAGTAGRDQVYSQRGGVSAVVGLGLGTSTQATIGFLHQSDWGRPDYGVPWIDIVATDRISHPARGTWPYFYGFKDDYYRGNADMATAEVRHQLASGWQFRDQLRYAWFNRSFRATAPSVVPLVAAGTPDASISVTRTVRGVTSSESLLSNQASLSGRFDLGGITHKVVIGGEIGQQTSNPTTRRYTRVPSASLIAPDETGLFSGIVTTKSAVRFSADTLGAYVGDTLEFGKIFEVEGVVRWDRFDAHYTNSVPKILKLDHTDQEPSYRAAFIYKLAPGGRLYAMWGTSFDPSAEGLSLSVANVNLVPERNQATEAGVKWELHRSALLSAAIFRTVKTNYREPSPLDPTVTTIAGTARSQGLELLAQGRVTPRWLVLTGYTYLDAQIIASPNSDLHQPLQNAPHNSVRLFSTYDLTPTLTVGGSLNASSGRAPSSFADPNGYRQRVPGFTTVSALARIQVRPGVSLQLNLQNLLDNRYYDGLDDNHVNVGAGRSVHLTLSVRP
jgi:catecholate siderophore receptor